VLVREDSPAVYVYRVAHDGLQQTGIWTLTHIDDYLEGRIKKHESTVARREQLLADYLQQTGLDANPVLITYHPDATVDALIERYVQKNPSLEFAFSDGSQHQIWAIQDAADLELIVSAFAGIPEVYIADGHHRIASMVKMGQQKGVLNGAKHQGTEAYNYFTTVYMNTREVKVLEFNRLVKDLGRWSPEAFLAALEDSFEVSQMSAPVKPEAHHQMGMYLKGGWYQLQPKAGLFDEADPVAVLDVSILQQFILDPLLDIKDPRTDVRITFEGGRVSAESLQEHVDQGNYAIAFTLYPPSVAQVMAVADANGVMPPKSTWVEPKFLVGLLTSYFN